MVAIVAPLPETIPANPPLQLDDIEYFNLPLPTLKGLWTIFTNAISINDWLVTNHPTYLIALMILWWHPILFKLMLWPLQSVTSSVLSMFGYEKADDRAAPIAHRHSSLPPSYSTFPQLEAGTIAPYESDLDDKPPVYAVILGWLAGILVLRAVIIGLGDT